MKNNPETRFQEFDEEWTLTTLREISNKVMEKNTDFSIREVFTNSAEHGVMSQRDFFSHAIANDKNINSYYIIQPNDFVYNPRMSVTAPVGPINRNALGRTGIMSPLYYVFRTHNIDVEYLDFFFKTRIWHQFMWNNGDNGARGDRFSIKNEVFQEMPIPYPYSPEEQHKIAQFFSRLDSLINAEDKKLERLKTIKSASLEKMFPKQGETVPEVRFKGFTGAWEEHRLSDFLKVYVEKNEKDTYSKYDIFSVSNECGVINQIKYQGKSLAGASLKGYKVTHKDTVIYTKSPLKNQPFGIIKTNKCCSGIVSTLYAVYTVNEGIWPAFIQVFFSSDIRLNNYLRLIVNKGAKNTLLVSDEDAISGTVVFPVDEKEQIYIAEYFSRLDTLISAQEQKSAKLRSLKKSFLEKMFVSTPK